MKKLSLVIAALAMVLGITQCKKQENPVGGKLITQEVTFTTSFGDGSKLDVTETGGTLDLSWKKGDEIKVTDNAETPNVSTLTCTSVSADGLTGTFKGTITSTEGAQLKFTVGDEPKYKEQHFTSITKDQIYLVGGSEFQQSGNYAVDMALPYAILKVDLSGLATADPANVSVTINDEADPAAVVTGVKANDCKVYLLLPLAVTDPIQTTLKFFNGTKSLIRKFMLAPNGFYTAGGTGDYAPVFPQGALPGLFSIKNGKQVYFSKGNLQYVKEGGKWQFAANQWETVETNSQNIGDNYANASVQTLFGFGDLTPLRTDNGTYKWTADWGKKIGTGWRTLSLRAIGGEWNYLLTQRDMTNGKPRYTNKMDGINIDGNTYKGLFIYPDDYNGAEVGTEGAPDTWDEIDGLGIVFLPAAGIRDGSSVYKVGDCGIYWSSYAPNEHFANCLSFNSSTVNLEGFGWRFSGYSVRLITELK